jgi:cell division protein FtsI (penicillin-binding protein 3)
MEKELFDLTDTFDCSEGVIFIGRRSVRDHKPFGILSFPEVFIHSSNVGAIQIGQRIGEDFLYQAIKSFRFGEKTEIDLPGEENGIFHPLASWTKSSLPSLSIGYEISVTAIQMLQTINVIANKGLMTNPRVVKETVDSPLKIKERPSPPKRVIPENKASELIHILERVVEEGTGLDAQIPGYKIAGKTGTAQKFDPSLGGYSSSRHLASFVGFVPTDKPAFSMIVVIDEPKNGLHYGGDVAAPVFREIARRVLLYLRVPPQKNPLKAIITAKVWRESKR